MPADLSEIDRRLHYCAGEIETIRREIAAFVNSQIELRQVPHPVGTQIEIRMKEDIPISISGRAGTTIHEIRSCLDSLSCRLAEANGQDTKSVYFPISKDASVFQDDGMRKISKLSPEDQDKIIQYAPHGDANPFLFGMHEFDRERKHNKLSVSSTKSGMGIGNAAITHLEFAPPGRLSTEWQRFAVIGHGTRIQFRAISEIEFEEPPQLKGREIVEATEAFLAEARKIVDLFR